MSKFLNVEQFSLENGIYYAARAHAGDDRFQNDDPRFG